VQVVATFEDGDAPVNEDEEQLACAVPSRFAVRDEALVLRTPQRTARSRCSRRS